MKQFLVFLASVLIFTLLGNVLLPAGFSHPVFDRDPAIDPAFRQQIDAEQPDVVVIGNSLIERGLDFAALSEQSGLEVMRMSSGGSGSALWYLFLKNEIAAAQHPPKAVVIVFKDNTFSVPNLSVDGKYQAIIDQFAGPDEPLLDQLAYLNFMPAWQQWLARNDAFVRYNPAVREALVDAARTPLVGAVFGLDGLEVDSAVNRSFAAENLDPTLLTQAQTSVDADTLGLQFNWDFDALLDQSFLPAIIQVAHENDIQLILVRYRARHYVEFPHQDNLLDNYFAAMSRYLAEQGVDFVDFSADERISMDEFAEGDHYNGDGQIVFTQMLAEALRQLVPAP